MPVRVELIDEAVEDLARYAHTDIFPRLLAKLIRLEEVGQDAGLPLGGGLAGWRKIVVGDRNWRIVFATDPAQSVATVLVIGDRADAECYDEAARRVKAMAQSQPHAVSLAAAMVQVSRHLKATKRTRRGKK
jgi:mRNA interferase RelE/StbE